MAETDYRKITLDGLWNNNPATVQILGLCPLLAVTGTVVNALGLGLAALVVLMGSNGAVSLIRGYVTDAVRLPAFVMIIAALVTVIEMLMRAFTFELYEILGIFIPLIVTNCTVLGRADAFASKNPVLPSLLDGFMMGAGFLVILVILGGMRERRHVRVEHDRERAIRMAIGEAKAGDIVLIAGKGHETEQIIGAERRPFSDRGIVSQILHGETGSEVSHGHA